MKLIVITPPNIIAGELEAARRLFDRGLQTLHLRKPGSTAAQIRHYLDANTHRRVVLHSHHHLVEERQLKASLFLASL